MIYVLSAGQVHQWDDGAPLSIIREHHADPAALVFRNPGPSLIDAHLAAYPGSTYTIDAETSEFVGFNTAAEEVTRIAVELHG